MGRLLSIIVLCTVILVPGTAFSQNPNTDTYRDILARCRSEMGDFGASMVKFCVDEDVEAVNALSEYPARWDAIVTRCMDEMLDIGGWAMVQFCADEDIAAEEELLSLERRLGLDSVGPDSESVCTGAAVDLDVPDGSVATREQMLDYQQRVQEQIELMQAYVDCLATLELTEDIVVLHNDTVDRMEALAQRFNDEVRAFREGQQ